MLTLFKRYVHTIRYLKFVQIVYRLYYLAYRPVLKTHEVLSRNPWRMAWSAPRYGLPKLSEQGIFSCFGMSASLSEPSVWNHTTYSKLWQYHLHYCDALNATDADIKTPILHHYLTQWLHNNPPAQGVGWEPYPISIRVVNWILWWSRTQIEPEQAWLESLIAQADVLMQRIEYHVLGNHVLVNAKALIFLGCYFTGHSADRWLQKGLSLLDRELQEQFLADGGHFELSPMYHALLLWDIADIITLSRVSGHSALTQRYSTLQRFLIRGIEWLSHMTHPDGDIAFFNDATLQVAPNLQQLLTYLAFLELPAPLLSSTPFALQALRDSGYIVVSLPAAGKCIMDVAEVGASYQPGHAHADTLSCELSVFGQRILVNSGVSEYGLGLERHRQRGTKAHNTVCINDQNSSEVWSGFRVAKRAFPRSLTIRDSQPFVVRCAHDGYARLLHTRTWTISSNLIGIVDEVQGRYAKAEARFYLHPDLKIQQQGYQRFICKLNDKQEVVITFDGAAEVRMVPAEWYPAFGVAVTNICLVANIHAQRITTTVSWNEV